METSRPVVVKRVPERLDLKQARKFVREVRPFLRADRPQIVLDLSPVKQIDSAGVDMLLHCMGEAMKRDGDVKLASLSPQAAVILELTRADRLFEIYENSTDAARSYSGFLPNALRMQQQLSEQTPPGQLAA
ncbi:MAG: STAS domain-containing protein [Candidatus Koribacter versatilis]|uniref:STAS domain-containing protein n=1 Tax=Candidatus Korobacter versatilis TaxID=658062 RepID=A0A932EQP0_9BACT|nr:STAS domain-containing protein [Candidatus Koribacter versatilis]